MCPGGLSDLEREAYGPATAVLEAAFVFVSAEVELSWWIKVQCQRLRPKYAVHGQRAFILVTAKAAHQIQVGTLLGQAQRHHFVAVVLSSRIAIVEAQPAVFVKGHASCF